jgi:hypothetical protein
MCASISSSSKTYPSWCLKAQLLKAIREVEES